MKKRSDAAAHSSLSRRELLQLAGVAALHASPLRPAARSAAQNAAWLAVSQAGAGPFQVVPPVPVVRAWDLLVLELDWRNLAYVPAGAGRPARLQRQSRGMPAYLILRFPPQHIAEEPQRSAPAAPVRHAPALSSRLVFRVPDAVDEIEYRLPVLLDACQRFAMAVSCRAPHPPQCRLPVTPPAPEETAIEAPYGLLLSPTGEQTWTHAIDPVISGDGPVELWHTRLTPPTQLAPGAWVGVRALSDIARSDSDFPDSVQLPTADQRRQIAQLSSNPLLNPFRFPEVITANRLMLSALGAWLDVQFQYDPPFPFDPAQPPFSVSGWRHQAVMGRDQFVQVTEEGYLLPFGHPAALITTRERRFENRGSGGPLVAYLYEQQMIVVRDPVQSYFAGDGTASATERSIPFRGVRLQTEVTPPIDNGTGTDPFLVKVRGQNFPFQLSAEDREGQAVNFSAPLVFVTRTRQQSAASFYNSLPEDTRIFFLNGQRIALVPAGTQSDPSLETDRISVAALTQGDSYAPALNRAWVRLPAVKQLIGSSDTTEVSLAKLYLDQGFTGAKNSKAQLFLQFAQSLPLAGGGTGGGLAQMQLSASGLSRAAGAVCGPMGLPGKGLDDFAAGTFRPEELFPNARLLGSLDLKDLLAAPTLFDPAQAGGTFPKLVVQPVPGAIEATFQWQTNQLRELPIFNPSSGGKKAELFLHSKLRKELTGNQAVTRMVEGRLSNFEIRLVGSDPYLTIQFHALSFRSQNGERPVIVPDIAGVQFGQALSFVQVLTQFLQQNGEGLSLDLVNNGIRAGYTLALPGVNFGVFGLTNISLSVGLYLPITGDEPLSFSFSFGQRFNPFHVAVEFLTGGGYFELELTPRGLLRLEASVEFGASLGLDLGVVSGKVEVMAGIRYVMMTDPDPAKRSVQLEGYLRASGALEVLEIVTLSVMIYLGLTYDIARGDVWGRATVTLEVKVLMFSKSVSFSYEQRFAGSAAHTASVHPAHSAARVLAAGRPGFEQYVSRDQWRSYCAAFA